MLLWQLSTMHLSAVFAAVAALYQSGYGAPAHNYTLTILVSVFFAFYPPLRPGYNLHHHRLFTSGLLIRTSMCDQQASIFQ
jgi:hypothetical protein